MFWGYGRCRLVVLTFRSKLAPRQPLNELHVALVGSEDLLKTEGFPKPEESF